LAKTVLFDLDGTISDSKPGIVNSTLHAVRRYNETTGENLVAPAPEALDFIVGPPLHISFAELFGAERAERVLAFYRERYSETGILENTIYPGIPEALQQLVAAGFRLYVATSKLETFAKTIIDHFALGGFFQAVHGAEPDGTRSNKGELIAYVLRRHAIAAEDATMIGDRKHDALGARANNVFPIGALWGYGAREELTAAGASLLLTKPDEIPGALRALGDT
jgi:phosphoglycolate phosphatase